MRWKDRFTIRHCCLMMNAYSWLQEARAPHANVFAACSIPKQPSSNTFAHLFSWTYCSFSLMHLSFFGFRFWDMYWSASLDRWWRAGQIFHFTTVVRKHCRPLQISSTSHLPFFPSGLTIKAQTLSMRKLPLQMSFYVFIYRGLHALMWWLICM